MDFNNILITNLRKNFGISAELQQINATGFDNQGVRGKTQKLGRQLKTVLKQIKAKERFPNHYPMKVQI